MKLFSAILFLQVTLTLTQNLNNGLLYNPFLPQDGNLILYNKMESTFIVTAPRIVRPDSIYRLGVVLLPQSPDLIVKATITRDNHYVASGSAFIPSASSDSLIMKIPPTITQGNYRLKVEGSDPLHPQKAVFMNESQIVFNSDFLSIIIQSNRAVYNNEMEVKFRVILLQMDLKPYDDPVTVYVLDPEGFIMRRWPSRHPTNGVISLKYNLPPFPSKGKWTIRVEALAQVYEQQFFVERYYITFFEIIPSAPVYVLDTDESYEAIITTAFHPEKVAKGNATVKVLAKEVNSSKPFTLVKEEHYDWVADFKYDVHLKEVQNHVSQLPGSVVRVECTIRDFFMGEERVGYIDTRIIRAKLKFQFIGTKTAVFKPGLPFRGYVYIMYDDNEALTPNKLARARLTLRSVATLANGQQRVLPEIRIPRQGEYLSALKGDDDLRNWMERQAEDAEYHHFRATGVHEFRLVVPKEAQSLKITAFYQDDDGDEVTTELQAIPYYSPQETYLCTYSSTKQGTIGEFAVIHVKSNYAFERVHYVIISKGMLVYTGQEMRDHASKMITFAVPISTEMAPTFKVVCMITSPLGDVIADSITIPVQSINRFKMNITLVQARDHSKKTVQLVTRTQPGSFIGVSVLRTVNNMFQANNDISPTRLLKVLYSLEPFTRSVHGVTWMDREGMKADRSEYFLSQNPAPDPLRTFSMAGLLLFTDGRVDQYPDTANCEKSAGLYSCLAVGCFQKHQRCDGNFDCADGSDEDDCPPIPDDKMEFRIFRRNRYHDFYDWLDGDWAWYDVPITDDGEEFHDRPVPITNEAWYINGFSFHGELGLSILDEVIEYDGTPPFYFALEAPSSIRRGETLGIRLVAVNNLNEETMALISLQGSDDYLFVETGPFGEVDHYKPKLARGERQHMIAVKPMSMQEVHIPIAPQVEQGTITVRIKALSQIASQEYEHELEILPEGATISRHTSVLVDLKNRANVLKFLDIPVEETPIIPYSRYRRYVFGSPRASATLCGDVFGPVFPTMPVTSETLLNRPLRGTEAHLFNLAATLWSLHYLRLTNQLESSTMYQAFNAMNVQMAGLMRLYDHHGSFKLHTNSRPSVWATAWVVRVLGQSQFQDWENHFFVDRRLLSTCVQWLLSYQNEEGSFEETDDYSYPLDRRLAHNSSRSVGHTAHVLISLIESSDNLQGFLKVATATAKLRAINYLERSLSQLQDPYEMAIVAYALTVANSPAKETAFGKLHNMRRENEGMIYWSRNKIPTNDITYENQRPFIQPRLPSQQDAVAVETTSYALLVYLVRDGIGDLQERVVTWLNTMRMVDGGFVSIFDSIVAMEALTEYAYRARLRDITEMTVTVEASASPNATQVIKINRDNLPNVYQFEIPNVWGHVNIIGRGAGQAVMQLNVKYGVDWDELKDKPKKPYFDLQIEETYSLFRNKSHVTVEACVKWLALDEAPHSGAAVLEVELPSGYGFVQSDGNELIKRKENSFLRDVLVASNKVIWMFDHIGKDRLCFNYVVKRWFPIANLTMYRSAIVYESYSPEHFEMHVFNATPLYVLDICEVCGSFQCPYCPYFSSASIVAVHSLVYFVHFSLLVYIMKICSL